MTILNTQSVKIPKQDGKLTVIQNFVGGNYAENLYYSYEEDGSWFLLGKYDVLTSLDDVWLKYEGNRTAVEIPIAYVTPPFNVSSSGGSGNNNQGDDMIKGYGIPRKDIQANVGDIYLDKNTGNRWICYYSRNNETAWFIDSGLTLSMNLENSDDDYPANNGTYDYFFPFEVSFWDYDNEEYEFVQRISKNEMKIKSYSIGRYFQCIDFSKIKSDNDTDRRIECEFSPDVYSDASLGFTVNFMPSTEQNLTDYIVHLYTDKDFQDDNLSNISISMTSDKKIRFWVYDKSGNTVCDYTHNEPIGYGKWVHIGCIVSNGEFRAFINGTKVYSGNVANFDNSKTPLITLNGFLGNFQYLRMLFSSYDDSAFNENYVADFTKGGINE